VYAIGGKHMRFDQTVQGLQNRGASTDLIGKRRQAEVDTFTGVTLPVQRLMLAELLEQDHGQQVWPCNAALCHERCRRLAWPTRSGMMISSAGRALSSDFRQLE
jgi:hypothetical protein